MEVCIIGIDCATDPRKTGLAKSMYRDGELSLIEASLGDRGQSIATTIATWLDPGVKTLIAIDAPLGWPQALGQALVSHQAGEPIDAESNFLFRRATDRFIKSRTGKQPLDVGADRIARTAHTAVGLLGELRDLTNNPIPLAWGAGFTELSAIEVYPAGTLLAYGMPATSYKANNAGHQQVREQIISQLRLHMRVDDSKPLLANADVLDAALCCLAGADFLHGTAMLPEDRGVAEKEGWIWVRGK